MTDIDTDIDINMDKDMSMSMSMSMSMHDYVFNEKGTGLLNNIIAARKISPTATYDALVALNEYITEKLSDSVALPKAKE